MDIKVGGIEPVGRPVDGERSRGKHVEARVLAVRAPRRRPNPDGHRVERREEGSSARDPINGRVLVLMVPDAGQLPEGFEDGTWRVFLRFARR